jgi:hypothetical protein
VHWWCIRTEASLDSSPSKELATTRAYDDLRRERDIIAPPRVVGKSYTIIHKGVRIWRKVWLHFSMKMSNWYILLITMVWKKNHILSRASIYVMISHAPLIWFLVHYHKLKIISFILWILNHDWDFSSRCTHISVILWLLIPSTYLRTIASEHILFFYFLRIGYKCINLHVYFPSIMFGMYF